MDFSWPSFFGGFWLFPILCLLFMAIMMLICGGMLSRLCRDSLEVSSVTRVLERNAGELASASNRQKDITH